MDAHRLVFIDKQKKLNGLDDGTEFNLNYATKMITYDVNTEIPGIEFHSYEENDNNMLTPHTEDNIHNNDMDELAKEWANSADDLCAAENITTSQDTEEIVADKYNWIDTNV